MAVHVPVSPRRDGPPGSSVAVFARPARGVR